MTYLIYLFISLIFFFIMGFFGLWKDNVSFNSKVLYSLFWPVVTVYIICFVIHENLG